MVTARCLCFVCLPNRVIAVLLLMKPMESINDSLENFTSVVMITARCLYCLYFTCLFAQQGHLCVIVDEGINDRSRNFTSLVVVIAVSILFAHQGHLCVFVNRVDGRYL